MRNQILIKVVYMLKIHVNKIENRTMFKTKTRYYLKLLTPETMKLEALKVRQVKIKTVKMFLI